MSALAFILVTLPLRSRAKAPVTGQYLWSSMSEVVLLMLAGSANGMVQVSMRDVRLDESGEEVATKSVLYGSTHDDRITLHVIAPPGHSPFEARFRANATITGHRNKSGILFLELDGQNVIMHPATDGQYRRRLSDLRIIAHFYHALKDQRMLESRIQAFIDWGHRRIGDLAKVAAFYRYREVFYRRCLSRVRSYAHKGASSADLPCVMSIDADTYALDSEHRNVLSWQPQMARQTGFIESGLKPVATRLRHWAMLAVAARARLSPDSFGRKMIAHLDRSLKSGSPLLDFHSLKSYRIMVPKVRASIRRCIQIVRDREPRLKALAAEIDLVSRTINSGLQS